MATLLRLEEYGLPKWSRAFTEFSKFREADNHCSMNWAQFKEYVPCWCCSSNLVSNTRGSWVAGFSTLTVMANFLSLN